MAFNPNNSPPSIDPADLNSLTGAFKAILKKNTQGIDGMIPATVVKFDRTTNKVSVQPMVSMVTDNGQVITRAVVPNIPVLQMGGGGMLLNFNLVPGDTGWLIAGDRDQSNYIQDKKISPPATYELKKFGFGMFIPGVISGVTIDPSDAANSVLQTKNGSVKISLGTGGVVITAPTVQINTSGDTTINATGNVAVTADALTATANSLNATITGTCRTTTPVFAVTGNITASGTITPMTP